MSNHGGRQIDHGLGAWIRCQRLSAAVNGRARIMLDGGVQRGTDILKAVALGADVVALGRLQAWGLSAAVQPAWCACSKSSRTRWFGDGPVRVDVDGPGDAQVRVEAETVTEAHEMSSWVNMPMPRIL